MARTRRGAFSLPTYWKLIVAIPINRDVNEPPHPHPPLRTASARKVVAMATIFAAWNTVFLPE